MSFFSDLGNIFHSIGSFITGGDNNNNQPQNNPTVVRPSNPAPQNQSAPVSSPAPLQGATSNPNQINLTPLFKPQNQITPANQLWKPPQTPPQQQPQNTTAGAPPPNNSGGGFFHAIETGAKDVGSAAAGASLAALRAGEGLVQGVTNLPNLAVHASNYIPRKIAGNNSVVNRVLSDQNTAAQNITNEVNKPFDWLGNKTDQAAQAYGNFGNDLYKPAQVAANVAAVVPAVADAASFIPKLGTAGKTGDVINAVKNFTDAQSSIPTLSKIPGVGPLLTKIPGLSANKAGTATDTNTPLSEADKRPDEVTVGTRSVNPNQVQDAIDQGNQKIAQVQPGQALYSQREVDASGTQIPEPSTTPAFQRAAPPAPAPQPTVAEPLDIPAFQHQQNLKAVVDQGNQELTDYVNQHPEATPEQIDQARQTITQQVTEQVNKLQEARRGEVAANPPLTEEPQTPPQKTEPPQPVPVEPPSGQPQQPATGNIPQAPLTQPPIAETPQTVAPPSENLSSQPPVTQENVAQPSTAVNPQPQNLPVTSDRLAPNAPKVRPQLEKELGDEAVKAGNPSTHYVLNNQALRDAAERTVAATPPEELLSLYANGVPKLQDAGDLAHAEASMKPLAALAKSEDAGTAEAARRAIDNIWEGAETGVSKAGRTMNYAQSMYDALPKEAKISLTIRTLNKAREAAGLDTIDSVADRAAVEQKLDTLLTAGENTQAEIARVEGEAVQVNNKLAESGDAVTRVQAREALRNLSDLQKQKDLADLKSAADDAQLIQFYNSLLPGKANTQKLADMAKTSMLTAPSGRINNVFNVTGNSLYEIVRSVPQALMNKVINLTKGAGLTEDWSLFNRGLVRGARQGVRTIRGSLKGVDYTANTKSNLGALKSANNYELAKSTGSTGFSRVRNTVNTLVRLPSNVLGGGIRDAQLVRLARQEGQQAGYTGRELAIYTRARSIVPSKQMAEKAQLLQDQVSHMNKNPLANLFSGFGKLDSAPGPAKGVLGIIKNTFLAFPKYPATFVWNTLTDRNVVADAVRLGKAAMDGDLNGVTKALSGGMTDSALMYAGYHLAQSGIITNKNAEGYSDGGMYIHVGDRYYPLGLFGVAAEGVLGGASIYNATNKGGNPVENFFKAVGNTIGDTIKMGGAQSLVGADNTAISATQDAIEGKNNVTYADAAAQVGGDSASTYIPSALSDVNAVLNQTALNPTHAAAQTKVTKGELGQVTSTGAPSKAKDIPRSELRVLANRIPGLSQTLPRDLTRASQDFVDRVTRGDHTGVLQAQTQAKTAAQKNDIASQIAAGVPVYQPPKGMAPKGYSFSNTLNDAIQTGKYDDAIKGLQSELKVMNQPGPAHIPPSAKEAVQDHIKQLTVFKTLKMDPKFMDTYKNTTLAQWRAMGDSTSSSYNPDLYQKLANLDSALAAQGVAGGDIMSAGDKATGKFYAKASGSGSSASKAASLVKNNKVGSLPALTRESFIGNLSAKPINVNIPQVPLTAPGTLLKRHTISVGAPHGNYN